MGKKVQFICLVYFNLILLTIQKDMATLSHLMRRRGKGREGAREREREGKGKKEREGEGEREVGREEERERKADGIEMTFPGSHDLWLSYTLTHISVLPKVVSS